MKTPETETAQTVTIPGRLLRMAEGYQRSGCPNQAIEMFFDLVERNAETSEGRTAREQLMAICETYEREGKMHQARGLYERLSS
jgi:hypothetical protein